MTSPKRIAITGLGAVSALGSGARVNFERARDGQGGIRKHMFDAGESAPARHELPAALPEKDFAAGFEASFGRKISASIDRFALYSLVAAGEAVAQAGLVENAALTERGSIVLGHGQGGLETMEAGFERFFGRRLPKMHPATVPKIMVSGAASAVAMQFGVHGPVFATSSACASSAHAVAQGAGLIRNGLADVAVVGGSEAIATPATMVAWIAIQALASETCRPFSAGRDGMVMGEGGAVIVLEDYAQAEKRGATILGEYLGAGMTSDAFHITQPQLEGVSRAMEQAVAAGGLKDEDEVLISAHGTGTPLNDANEAAAIKAVFGDAAMRHPVIATKSAHGHMIGGTAALQAVIVIQALRDGVAPPILNYLGPDPECDVNLVTGAARQITAKKALVNAFAFGGLNVAMAFGR